MREPHAFAVVDALASRQAGLMRSNVTCAALIPIRKTVTWWRHKTSDGLHSKNGLVIFGLKYQPGVARRVHHSRELGEPFDFLTWFEYPPEDADAFEKMLVRLRATLEWQYIDLEFAIRLSQA